MAFVVSDWCLNAELLWQNAHGWVCRRQESTRPEAVGGKVWVGFRPAENGLGDKIRPDGDLSRDLVWAGGYGELWAPDLETLMQRVDERSYALARLRAVSAPLHHSAVAAVQSTRPWGAP